MDVIVNPPKEGEPSHASHSAQKETVLTGLAARAKLVAETFNSMDGITCNTVQVGHLAVLPPFGKSRNT